MQVQSRLVLNAISEINKKTSLAGRRTLYISKVRGTAKYGMEIWSGTDKHSEMTVLDANENRLLRALCGCNRRPKVEATTWWLKLQRLSTIAIVQGFNLWMMALRSVDTVDMEAVKFWRHESLHKGRGWLHELGMRLKNVGLLECEEFHGSMEKFLRWDGENAYKLKGKLKDCCIKYESQEQYLRLRSSKHKLMTMLWTDMKLKRPWEMMISRKASEAWTKLTLCEHILESAALGGYAFSKHVADGPSRE